ASFPTTAAVARNTRPTAHSRPPRASSTASSLAPLCPIPAGDATASIHRRNSKLTLRGCLLIRNPGGRARQDLMVGFQLDAAGVQDRIRRAAALARTAAVSEVVERAGRGDGLSVDELALLWSASVVDAEGMYQLALEARAGRRVQLETFSPLYMTNTCDA